MKGKISNEYMKRIKVKFGESHKHLGNARKEIKCRNKRVKKVGTLQHGPYYKDNEHTLHPKENVNRLYMLRDGNSK